MRFPLASALLGSLMFVSSRITIMATGTPPIDASFLAAVAIVAYLSATNRVLWLSALLPVLMLTKETMVLIPVLLVARFALPGWRPNDRRVLWGAAGLSSLLASAAVVGFKNVFGSALP